MKQHPIKIGDHIFLDRATLADNSDVPSDLTRILQGVLYYAEHLCFTDGGSPSSEAFAITDVLRAFGEQACRWPE